MIVEGWVRIAPDDVAKLSAAGQAMVAATRQEPGCLDYAFAADIAEPGLLRIVERWADEAALTAHFAAPHMAAFNAALGAVKIHGASVKVYAAELQRTIMET